MFTDYINAKKEKYIKEIIKTSKMPISEEKNIRLSNLLEKYSKFCYAHNLQDFFPEWLEVNNSSFILPSEPDIIDVDEEALEESVNNFLVAKEENGAISLNDVETILTGVVQKARAVLGKDCDIKTASLDGCCGYGQALTAIPLLNIGADVTINNAGHFPYAKYRHAFITVAFPVNEFGVVQEKRYLVDVTYRQFFTTATCNEGRYFKADERFKDTVGPAPGFYMMRYPGGKEFANELLKKGFIELTPENLKTYGVCFSTDVINKTNTHLLPGIFQIPKEVFEVCLVEQEELDFTPEDIEQLGTMVNFPTQGINR